MVPNLILSGLGTTAVWPLRFGDRYKIRSPNRDMNYRHAFHAGNFAEIVSTRCSARVIAAVAAKADRVPHPRHPRGARRHRSDRTAGDPHRRMARRHRAPPRGLPGCDPVRQLLAPYLDVVAALNPGGRTAQLSRLSADRAKV